MKSASTTICGGEQRVRNVYMSDTHEIQVEVMSTHHDVESAEFLLKYQGGTSAQKSDTHQEAKSVLQPDQH